MFLPDVESAPHPESRYTTAIAPLSSGFRELIAVRSATNGYAPK